MKNRLEGLVVSAADKVGVSCNEHSSPWQKKMMRVSLGGKPHPRRKKFRWGDIREGLREKRYEGPEFATL